MDKSFIQKPDQDEERSQIDKQSDLKSKDSSAEQRTIPYEVHQQGPLTYFHCDIEDIKRSRQPIKSPVSSPASLAMKSSQSSVLSRSLVRGLMGLSLLALMLGVGWAVVHFSSPRSQPPPKAAPKS